MAVREINRTYLHNYNLNKNINIIESLTEASIFIRLALHFSFSDQMQKNRK